MIAMVKSSLFSPKLVFPVQPDVTTLKSARTIIDWRGIPLAVPYAFDEVGPNQLVLIAKRFSEGEQRLVKLVHPEKGTTVDYALRCLFNPNVGRPGRAFAFLEMAQGCPEGGKTVPVWTVVEVVNPGVVRTLGPAEIEAEQAMIDEIIERRLCSPPEAAEATFGPFASWRNPDYGERGNLYLVCVGCLAPLAGGEGACPDCARPRTVS